MRNAATLIAVAGAASLVVLAAGPAGRGGPALPGAPAGATAEHREGRHLALLIGISDYLWYSNRGQPGRTDLTGPANDVVRMQRSLRRFGFEGDGVRVLVDKAATRQGIFDGLAWLSEQATSSDDVIVVYYSGHGSQALDRDGDEEDVTPGDRIDEALVPSDADDNTNPDELVLDDDLREWLAGLPTENVTLIIDACYSGTATRGDPGDGPTPRGPIGSTSSGSTLEVVSAADHTLLTAAAPNELALEDWFPEAGGDGKIVFGVFTYHLTRALDGATDQARYDEIMRRVRADVVSHPRTGHTPQLEGDMGARLFNVRGDLPRRQYVMIEPLAAGGYEIDAGAVHGVRESALYDVYPPGEKAFSGQPLAQVRVDSIGRLVSRVRVVGEPNNGGLEPGSRGALARAPLGVATLDVLTVHVDSSAREVLPALALVEFVAAGSPAATTISREGNAFMVSVGVSPIAPTAADAEWTEQDPATGLIGWGGSAEAICRPLRRAFAIEALARIENPEPPPGLEVDVRLIEAGRTPTEEPTPADTAYIEDVRRTYSVWARVSASESSVLYFSAAVPGFLSDPIAIYPGARSMNQPFKLNVWQKLPGATFTADPPGGEEFIVAVATSDQYDFHSLISDATGRCGGAVRGLADKKSDAAAVTGWTSVTRRIVFVDNRSQ